MWNVENAIKRNANVYHVYIACMIAKFRELGLVNYGVIKGAAEATGRCTADYFLAHGLKPSSVEDAIVALNEITGFTDEVKVDYRDGVLEVRMHRDSCRICPRMVGGLELPGAACPNVGYIKGFVEGLGLAKLEDFAREKGEEPVTKDGEYCVIRYVVKEASAPVKEEKAVAARRV
ncbi:hypothetical protein [Thermofilum pendens]|uniref:4-vinyl reductase 4VR domain-containing protein n=1 Tax=Thermofilum pendens (strain DSM 2475 / Hrk 5) TaxID=368408 RepID=A1RYX2_THEPD|nr:hypothetical protein [Thermofilum pendens]ABL78402.1 hypothetical protein Tpen_1002 [Thermofilum pendens Hrk 5]